MPPVIGALMKSLMASEMAEQPEVVAALVARRPQLLEELRSVLPPRPVGLTLVARGTSMNAAVYGRYVLELSTRRPVAVAAPSIHTLYGAEVDYHGWVGVAASQSGRTPEIVTLVAELRRQGAVTVGITNDVDSPLAAAVDVVIDLAAGHERAVPATKTFTAQVTAFALLAESWGGAAPSPAWDALPRAIAHVLDDPSPAEELLRRLDEAPEVICVGRGHAFGIALEVALKLRETAGVNAAGYSSADVRHGAIAAAGTGDLALLFATQGIAGADTLALVDPLTERRVGVVRVGDAADADLPTPAGLPERLAVLPMVVRGQQLALGLALRRGLDPDRPAGLTKVTRT